MPAGSLFQDQHAMTKDERQTPPDASTDEKRPDYNKQETTAEGLV